METILRRSKKRRGIKSSWHLGRSILGMRLLSSTKKHEISKVSTCWFWWVRLGDAVLVLTMDLHPRGHGDILRPCPHQLLLQQNMHEENPKLERKNHLRPKSEAAPARRALREPTFVIVMDKSLLAQSLLYFLFRIQAFNWRKYSTADKHDIQRHFFFGLFISKIKIPGCGTKECLTFIGFGACGVHLCPRMQIHCSCSE